ncbi:MAG: hypothetical protein S4CHLAM20_00610 [Chlamydiia bacterium]|nr:hypothetical protein [Chlamydiia bacterium]
MNYILFGAPLLLANLFLGYVNPWKKSTEVELQKNYERLSEDSLNRYARCIYTQYGEDGIIEEIFNRIGVKKGFCVEFGAMDGVDISNTRHLLDNGWEGVMIEPNNEQYKKLEHDNRFNKRIQTINSFVTWHDDDPLGQSFDEIRNEKFPDREIDFLSIDVDGGDYYILKGLNCRPKVICVETNLRWHPLMDQQVPEHVALGNLQQPIEVFIKTAKEMGYEPVALTINLFLVRKDLYEPFKEIKNDALSLWRNAFRALPLKNSIKEIRTVWNGVNYQVGCPITEDF